jgi:Zn-dependent protease
VLDAQLAAGLREVTLWALPVLFAIPLHEAAHGLAAWRLGDDTAYRLGRVTLNPLRHIDPFGTVILPALLLMAHSPFLFGYAKPVPVAFNRLRNPRRDTILVAAAGPAMNIILAFVSGLLIHIGVRLPFAAADWAVQTLDRSILLNLILALFNMIPLPPLDGGRVAVGLLPKPIGLRLAKIERHGILILLVLLVALPLLGQTIGYDLNLLPRLLFPALEYLYNTIVSITGIGGIVAP